MLSFASVIGHYAYNSNLLYHLRIFIAMASASAIPCWLGLPKLTIPLTLWVVAAALTDLDDRLAGRLRSLLIALVCFFIASASIELLFPYPWLFAFDLTISTCGFILLGALGQRYATIAFGTLLIAVYTMLGTALYDAWYHAGYRRTVVQPATLTSHVIFPIRLLQENLARCYNRLANFLDAKAYLFDPDAEYGADPHRVDVPWPTAHW